MSKIEVDAIEPQSGTDLTIGASGDTITVPAGATLVNNGTASGFGDNLEWQSTIVTGTTLTAEAGKGYWINTTSNACTVTLPASASVGDTIEFSDYLRTWGTNSITLNTNSLNFQGNTSPNPEYNTSGQSVRIVYSGATQGWIPTVDDDVTLETPQTYSVDFLVIAGGGGGGYYGGGGAGGYRNSFSSESSGGGGSSETALSLTPTTTYTITVGAGGAGTDVNLAKGTIGENSSISGTGITTITSIGGGGGGGGSGGGGAYKDGIIGGSGGGGGGGFGTGASGTSNQGYAGGNGQTDEVSFTNGGGGGGAGAVGTNGTLSPNTGGNGGNGLSSSITGSAVTRAGGGGAGADGGGNTGGTGGTGGGGDGADSSGGSGGTVNTGSGGGGNITGYTVYSGGSGVVILSMLDADYSGITTGSPTVATGVSGKTVLTFNGDGSYTA